MNNQLAKFELKSIVSSVLMEWHKACSNSFHSSLRPKGKKPGCINGIKNSYTIWLHTCLQVRF